ncbi:AAA family ATPase [Rhizobium hidalgonense]|uniref:AAA family ATPase n=1 Tax=Rhizobium hidalgonense TaxID=1538159 RepID=UPI002870DC6D|nr:AAA family ATPase [Rhizobium hidalgonense]MDR9807949.1 AAA family ATPase [Rhizobium hidalgonense]
MNSGFRLISARTTDRIERSRWDLTREPRRGASVAVSFPQPANHRNDHNEHVSILLGRNGQGKSRLLSAIAGSIQLLENYQNHGLRKRFPLSELAYSLDGDLHQFALSHGNGLAFSINGAPAEIAEVRLPNKVIALSMTPFDKFPIGNADQNRLALVDPREVYHYFGMRDRMGRASVTTLLFRAVSGLFSRSHMTDRSRIAEVFDLIGYQTNITTVFRIDSSSVLRDILNGQSDNDVISRFPRSERRLTNEFRDDPEAANKIRAAASQAIERATNNFVTVSVDVEYPAEGDVAAFEQMQLLRRYGVVRLAAVEVQKKSGERIDLKQASSGELSIAISFMSLSSSLEDNSLVLIDEPETNLHPEWQAKYVDLLTNTFSMYKGCHYILATHSPLILSDAPPTATLCSVSDNVPTSGDEVSGRSADFLLAKAFQTVSGDNSFLQELLVAALRLAADGETKGQEFVSTMRELLEIRPLIQDNPGAVELINDLEKIHKK